MRRRASRREYRFNGLTPEIYLKCDATQTVGALMKAPSTCERASEAEVIVLLDQFDEWGLILPSGKQYVNLAVVRNY